MNRGDDEQGSENWVGYSEHKTGRSAAELPSECHAQSKPVSVCAQMMDTPEKSTLRLLPTGRSVAGGDVLRLQGGALPREEHGPPTRDAEGVRPPISRRRIRHAAKLGYERRADAGRPSGIAAAQEYKYWRAGGVNFNGNPNM